ncbi:hypothetical protein BDY19DRAFT_888251 [Irpex rosettiformis]|uniref:Uncharacterized protein n=1 Tax=Irpex rosettiformis TaxID=378272 RepID=A0ACB8U730_9APHY|nr:hypothetical protein BDY19DRAFT_888251 [Irpex rosettiformis]
MAVAQPEDIQLFLAEDANVDADVDSVHGDFLQPGIFVELRRNGMRVVGIVMGVDTHRGLQTVLTMISNGTILEHRSADITFIVPGFIDDATVARCGSVISAELSTFTDSEISARLEVLKRVQEIEKTLDFDSHRIALRAEQAIQELRPTDSMKWETVSTMEIAERISGNEIPSVITMLGVHRYLMEKYKRYVAPGSSFLVSQTFLIRPKDIIDNLNYVEGLVARRDPRVTAFLEKARQIIASKPSSPSSMSSVFTVVPHPTISFTEDDQAIIQFMKNFLRAKRSIQTDPHRSSTFTIMRLLGLNPDRVLNDDLVHAFLVDIGALSPWTELRTIGAEVEAIPIFKNVTYEGVNVPQCPGPDEFYPRDIVAHLRHDFGDAPVYVIDDATAKELDDGLSIERDTEDDGCYWLHVHIADPTALLHPMHEFSKQARHLNSSRYFICNTESMLPPSLVHQGISLGSGASPQKTLTFSAKVDQSGDIVDYAVCPGIVRNVQVVTYTEVNEVLGNPSRFDRFPFGQPPAIGISPRKPHVFEARHVEDLRAMDEVRRRLTRRAREGGALAAISDSALISVQNTNFPESTDHSRPHFFFGDPHITYTLESGFLTMAQRTVAEAMKAAGRVASMFFRDRGVPALRRHLPRPVSSDSKAFLQLLSRRNEYSEVSLTDLYESKINITPGGYTLESKGHWSMAIPDGEGYVRVTSPLRRYSDLIHHWQVKYALLESNKPCFSSQSLTTFGTEQEVQERYSKQIHIRDTSFWAIKFIEQFVRHPRLVDGRNPLEDLEVLAVAKSRRELTSGSWRVPGRVESLGLKVTVLNVQEHVDSGDILKARFHSIQLGTSPALFVQPV